MKFESQRAVENALHVPSGINRNPKAIPKVRAMIRG
jgi:hypothetical protein